MKRLLITILLLAAALMTMSCEKQQAAQGAPPPPAVSVVPVSQQDVPIYGEWEATLQGYQNAQIQPQVSGYLVRQNYREGSMVHKGDVLFEIDPRPFQAAVDQAKGQLAQAQGQLAQAQASLDLSEINVKRDTPLADAHAIAQSQLDSDLQGRAGQKAGVSAAQAGIAAAQAAVEKTELDLGFTKVRSLLDGVAGIATTQIGNLVSTTTVLTTVSQLSPIKAYFSVTDREYMEFTQQGRAKDWVRAANGRPLTLTLATGQTYKEPGHILFADRQVNSQTGTILLVASFANPGGLLRPGQFGRIRSETSILRNALVIPQRAVAELQGHYLIDVVDSENKVRVRPIELGPRVGQLWIVNSGAKAGDRVITEGISKVKDGMTVQPEPDKTPKTPATEAEGI